MPANISKLPGIYIHIPYCDTKCGYCDFYSITSSAGRRQFVPALKKEINHYSVSPFLEKTFDTMYMGGGTPSLLEPAELDVLFTYIFQKFSFSPNTEITIEVNPGTLNGEKLAFYRSIGINRLSIGVQSFFDSD